jgi:lycopene cyclase domain-containing protein
MEFLESKYLYLGLMIFALSYPLAQSFEWRIHFYKKWKRLFKAIAIMMVIFIPWDVWKTQKGVWWFNDKYILGWKVWHLPIEEWLFFIIIPFACVFLYEVLKFYVKKDFFGQYAIWILRVISLLSLVLSVFCYPKVYPLITFSLTGLFGFFVSFQKNIDWLGRFLFAYLVILIPFFLVNGILTGMLTSEALVNYNPEEFLGIRMITIPIEDSVYGFLMLLFTIFVYEKKGVNHPTSPEMQFQN